MNRLENIFKEPNQWGLRGDPYLWTYLKSYFTEHDLPSTKEDFEIKIKEIFLLKVGVNLGDCTISRVEEFAHGGMSSGGISHEFWMKKGLTLLLSRFDGDNGSESELKKIQFGSCGYFGPQDLFILDLENKKILKESREFHGDECPVTKTTKNITSFKIKQIMKVLELLQINELEKYYNNSDILDGEQWSFEAHYSDGTVVESGGSNAYPEHFEKFRKIFKPLD